MPDAVWRTKGMICRRPDAQRRAEAYERAQAGCWQAIQMKPGSSLAVQAEQALQGLDGSE
jgi:hypothetical protein